MEIQAGGVYCNVNSNPVLENVIIVSGGDAVAKEEVRSCVR